MTSPWAQLRALSADTGRADARFPMYALHLEISAVTRSVCVALDACAYNLMTAPAATAGVVGALCVTHLAEVLRVSSGSGSFPFLWKSSTRSTSALLARNGLNFKPCLRPTSSSSLPGI